MTPRNGLLALLVLAGVCLGATRVLAGPAPLPAHELGQSYMFLRVHDESIVVRLEITVPDLERALGLGWANGEVDRDEVAAVLDSIREYVEPRFEIATPAGRLDPAFRDFDLRFLEVAEYVQLNYEIAGLDGTPDLLETRYEVLFEVDRNHRNFLIVEHNWKTATFNSEAVAAIFSPGSPRQTLDLTSSSVLRGFLGFIWLGVWHIWIGIDHILFLVALVLPSVLVLKRDGWRPASSFHEALIKIVKIVTFFTVAHTVTLSLAALDVVRMPSRLVESIIAASIAVAAWHNLSPRFNVREGAIAFVFGLFHGFGFASVLGDIGFQGEYLALSLLGFNVGVEVGQVAVIVAVFPLLFLMRRNDAYQGVVLRYGSMALIAVAALWVFERVSGLNVPLGLWAGRLMTLAGAGPPSL